MAEVGFVRLTSLERVTMGAGSVYRGARTKLNSLGRSLRPFLSGGVVSMTLRPKFGIYGQKMPNYSGTDLRYCICIQCLPEYNAENSSVTNELA